MNETELFKMLFNAYYEKVCRSTYLIVQNEHIARDATQEAFIAAYKHLNSLKDLDYCMRKTCGLSSYTHPAPD